MNLEQRRKYYQLITNVEALLAFAIRSGDKVEIIRLQAELAELIRQSE